MRPRIAAAPALLSLALLFALASQTAPTAAADADPSPTETSPETSTVTPPLAMTYLRLPIILFSIPYWTPTPSPTRTATPTVTPTPGWQTLVDTRFGDDYRDDWPGPWRAFDGNGTNYGEYYWAPAFCHPYGGSGYSGWAVKGGEHALSTHCGDFYPDYADSWMVSGPFSLQGANAADLRFQMWLNSEPGYDGLCRLASVNGADFSGYCTTGNSNGWVERSLDLGNVPDVGSLLGQPQVWVALVFVSDPSHGMAEGAWVDSVLVRRCMGANCPPGTSISGSDGAYLLDAPAFRQLRGAE